MPVPGQATAAREGRIGWVVYLRMRADVASLRRLPAATTDVPNRVVGQASAGSANNRAGLRIRITIGAEVIVMARG